MQTLTLTLPLMYADHHVTEVRRILQSLTGVADVYASSCFHTAEISYDPAQINADVIEASLAETGYLQELALPTESSAASYGGDQPVTYFRHTSAFEPAKKSISFAQEVANAGRPLWPCPGVGVIKSMDEGD
ncbi:MAG: heavy-metal-associated domain-containing protein [Anaerolineae bacterium]|nr:heavy-metal-associated domain-containing protein [Anaerolineae bacterium]